MRSAFVKAMMAATAVACLAPPAAWAQTSKPVTVRAVVHDLTVELRQVKDGEQDSPNASSGAYTVGTANRAVDFVPQQVRVRSGEKASLQINQSMPMQWVQKIESQSATLSAAGSSASSQSGGVTQAVTWMESGQSFTVTPHWPGGKRAVKLEIEVQSSAVDERTSSDLPATARQRYSTTVSAPLNQWVTIATSGRSTRAGSYSSSGTSDARRLLQIRVTAD
ncbi:MAG: hypothetical protein Q7T69_03130 [Rhodoferax sp.]|nr:hypothetical protein [Rhodoferax sp.]